MTAPESRTSKRILKGKEREAQAMTLRLMGATYAEIGSMMGISSTGAYKAVCRAIQRLQKQSMETADEYRRLELERLDKMQRNLWAQVMNGNLGAIDRVLRIMERRAKLLGLDAPAKQDITSAGEKIVVRLSFDDGDED